MNDAVPVRAVIATVYGLDADRIRVIAPDVGGSFGSKARPHPEELLLPWLARRVGRPARWVPARSGDMIGLGHSRGQRQRITVGGDRDGTIRALREMRPDLPIIATSGLEAPEALEAVSGADACPFLLKPFSTEELLHAVDQALHPDTPQP